MLKYHFPALEVGLKVCDSTCLASTLKSSRASYW